MSQLFYTEAHDHFRRSIRAFVEKEIEPYIEAWEEAESFPIELYRKAADVGLLGLVSPKLTAVWKQICSTAGWPPKNCAARAQGA